MRRARAICSCIGGACGSFYDWYCDLPPASPQTWGEQTDVAESADWYNSGFLILWGSNVPQTRTPDAHFYTEARYKGVKSVVICPDYSEASKFADLWIFGEAGHGRGAREWRWACHPDRIPSRPADAVLSRSMFAKYTDMPLLVRLVASTAMALYPIGWCARPTSPARLAKATIRTGRRLHSTKRERSSCRMGPSDFAGARREVESGREGRQGGGDELAWSEGRRRTMSPKVRFPYFANTASNGFASTDHPQRSRPKGAGQAIKLKDGEALVACVLRSV
jgi:nitrate reductase alpha subunit